MNANVCVVCSGSCVLFGLVCGSGCDVGGGPWVVGDGRWAMGLWRQNEDTTTARDLTTNKEQRNVI